MCYEYPVASLWVICNYRPQRSWGKVMFLQVCVILFTGGGCVVLFGGVRGFIRGGAWFYSGGRAWFYLGGHGFFSFCGYNEIRSMSGRYASYWNAFLFVTFGYFDSLLQSRSYQSCCVALGYSPRTLPV